MKLAYVTALFPYAHAEQFFEEELRSLSQAVDVTVIPTRPPSRAAVYRDVGTPLHLPLLSLRVVVLAARETLRNPVRTLATFAQLALGPRSSLRARLVNVAAFPKALAVANEVRRLGIDHIHAAWLTTPATIAWVASRMTGVPFSATAHQHDIFAGNLAAQKVGAAAFVRVISERNARHLREQLAPELARRVVVGHLGVAIPPALASHPPRTPRILCAARLCSWKGHRDLLDALALLRARGIAFVCDLAGDGELRDEVTATIARLDLGDRVRLLGNVPHAELVSRLAAGEWDVFALASTERQGEHEGIPVAVMEAMAAGLPVVATATGSLDELVGPAFGMLVPQRDPQALARALTTLLADDVAREHMGRAAREKIRADFETTATTRILLDFLRRSSPAAPTF